MTDHEESRPLTPGEQLLREIDTNTYWGIGRMGCHDIPAPPRIDRSPKPGEPYYVVSLNVETGEITTTHFDGDGSQIVRGEA